MEKYIVNYWWTENYGAILTAFAAQQLIKNAILINNKDDLLIATLKNKNRIVSKFENKNLNTTKSNTIIDISKNKTYITGSDQVFRISTQKSTLLSDNLLDKVPLNSKKIAFSASFGVNKEEFLQETSKEKIEHMKNSLKSFDCISVREKSGVEICRDLFDVKAEWIIDPVFILDRAKWDELISDASGKILNQVQNDVIVSYVLDTNKEYKKAYKYLSKQHNADVI